MGDRGVLDLGGDVITLDNGIVIPNNHLASPDAHVDHENQRIVLYFHSGSSTYVNGTEVDSQLSYVSYSPDGLDFYDNIQPVFLGDSYFRVFRYGDNLYALTNDGTPYKALNADAPWSAPDGFDFTDKLWEKHPNNPFQADITEIDGIPSSVLRVRHTDVRLLDDELQVFYSRRGDLLENIQMSSIDLSVGDWTQWDATYPPYQILQSAPGWEGGDLTPAPSETSTAPEDVNQLRDPYVFEDTDGSLYLFYTGRGEDAIGLVQLREAHATVSSVNPLMDAFVQGGSSADANFGTLPALEVNQGTDPDLHRKTYILFDLSQTTEVDHAVIRLYANSGISCPITAYEASNSSWTEEGITWNNAPETGAAIVTTQLGSDSQYYEWEITEYVKRNLGAHVSLVFYDESASDQMISFSSKEGDHAPELKLFTHSTEYSAPPSAPSPLYASAVSPSEINLNWIDNAINEEGFRLERKEGDGAFQEIASLDADVASYSDKDLQSSTYYTYRVFAFNAEGNSDYSNEASAGTFPANFVAYTYNVTEDTYVRGGEYATINYGSEADLIVKTGNKEDFFRNTLVKIDLSSENLQDEEILRAVLRVYAYKTEDCDITASEMDDSWSEHSVTWSSAPVTGNKIASAPISAKDIYYEWDITSYLKSQLSGDGVVSVCLKDYAGASANVNFYSKEATDNHPELVLSFDGPLGSTTHELIESAPKIYPNPAKDFITITDSEGGSLNVYNYQGYLVLSSKATSSKQLLDMSGLCPGIYFVNISNKGIVNTIKVIKL